MVNDMSTSEGNNGSRESREESSGDILELRLPPRAEFLPLVRATAGVIGGGLSFGYDEIVQLRTAAAEAFEVAVQRTRHIGGLSSEANLTIRFTITPDKLEIFIPIGEGVSGTVGSQVQVESEALLASLMDEVELHNEAAGGLSLRLVKFRPTVEG